MPYINQKRREEIYSGSRPETAGELNFVITLAICDYLDHPAYGELNEVIGVLESVKLEFCRRVVFPYEDTKLAQNGDVYK